MFYSDPKTLDSLSTILMTRLLITIIVTGQDTDSKYFCARHWAFVLHYNASLTGSHDTSVGE